MRLAFTCRKCYKQSFFEGKYANRFECCFGLLLRIDLVVDPFFTHYCLEATE